MFWTFLSRCLKDVFHLPTWVNMNKHHCIFFLALKELTLSFQTWDTPGDDGLFTSRCEKIFCYRRCRQTPRCRHNWISQSCAFPGVTNHHKIPPEGWRGNGLLQVIASSCKGMDADGYIGSVTGSRLREGQTRERRHSYSASVCFLRVFSGSYLPAFKTIRPSSPLYPMKEVGPWNKILYIISPLTRKSSSKIDAHTSAVNQRTFTFPDKRLPSTFPSKESEKKTLNVTIIPVRD